MASEKIVLTGDIKSMVGTIAKKYGKGTASIGGTLTDLTRIPTGLFELDLALGGGFPAGKISTIFGKESSNKTNIALLAVKNYQRMFPEKMSVFVDLENSFDPEWATKLGVDVDRMAVLRPDYAEQAADLITGMLTAPDLGVIVVDSLAAMVTYNESESSAEKAMVGGAALQVGRLLRGVVQKQLTLAKIGQYPTVICINQTREKVGVMYGSNETEPGGNAPKFFSTIRLRVYGKNIFDKKVSEVMPVLKNVTAQVIKWKVPILNPNCEFKMATADYGHLKVGESDDWNAVSHRLKDYGLLGKEEKKGWFMLGEAYPTLSACQDRYQSDRKYAADIRKALIEKVLADSGAFLKAQAPTKEEEEALAEL